MAGKKKIKVLSLFAGAGGLDIGFAKAGFNVILSSELDEIFCKTLEINKPFFSNDHKVVCGDIAEFKTDQYDLKGIQFIIGGPPCQSFSAAGRRAGGVTGINDLRGSLFWHYCRILKGLQPKGFLFENVRGILQANKKDDWETIKSLFASIGYRLFYRVLDAAEYGVPQHRERLIMIGLKVGDYKFPRPTHGPKSKGNIPYIGTRESMADLQDPNEVVPPYGGKWGPLLDDIPPGMNYLYFTEKMGHPEPKFAWRSRFSDFLAVAHPDRPCKTLVARMGKFSGPFHWKKRKFTFPEFKRLQSFPDDYKFYGSYSQQMMQLGNSVPPRMAEILAKSILQQVFNIDKSIELIDENFELAFDKRKSQKAKKTREKVRPNSQFVFNNSHVQLNLFDKTASPPNKKLKIKESWLYSSYRKRIILVSKNSAEGNLYDFNATLSKGVWRATVNKANAIKKKAFTVSYIIKFYEIINGSFDKITCDFTTDDEKEIAVAWDAIDRCVQETTSYDSINKLYGHFTEPYIRFAVKIESSDMKDKPILSFSKELCDFNKLGKIIDIEILKNVGDGENLIESVKLLRKIGFDIRTYQTNRAIPYGKIKICYPFTLPLDQQHSISWLERGQHITADVTSIPKNSDKLAI